VSSHRRGAVALIRRLAPQHGPLMFHQSGGCCDGSAPMCYPRASSFIGARDVLLGVIDGCPFYIGGRSSSVAAHRLMLDVVPGRGAGFSLEAPEGVRFLIRSRCSRTTRLAALDEPLRGAGRAPGSTALSGGQGGSPGRQSRTRPAHPRHEDVADQVERRTMTSPTRDVVRP
jgi:uncharacterized protein (DUF779 family)